MMIILNSTLIRSANIIRSATARTAGAKSTKLLLILRQDRAKRRHSPIEITVDGTKTNTVTIVPPNAFTPINMTI